MKTLTIDGDKITDIPSFYDEINHVFMADEDWKLAPSLDALDDMLYGSYGAAAGDAPVGLVWKNMEKSRNALGFEATKQFYAHKLERPEMFDAAQVNRRLAELESGAGPTYFEIVLEIIASHPRIRLVAG
ncbi:MAG: barstar family protein [Pseudochelatococcus sp.]|jgi:RNAse (barnase) inhibitor barstar|uniref:barstar family protein n=1 Tax=Pseudochelatococcus sp. TaxID=2020869 RepID=UPI003D8C782E